MYLNQNQTHALLPKVTLPASPRLLYNPIMGGIATYTQLPSWSARLKMRARFEFSVVVMPCFDLGFCKGLQKGRVGTVTIEPEKTVWEETGGCIKIHDHWTNSLTPQEMSSKDFLHLHAITLHYKSPELVWLESFDPCSAFACALETYTSCPSQEQNRVCYPMAMVPMGPGQQVTSSAVLAPSLPLFYFS